MTAKLYILHAQGPLHVGTGDGDGVIDLPIARDVVTEHPLVPGSSIKGVLRAACYAEEAAHPERTQDLFGPRGSGGNMFPSAIRLSDAITALFPVRSDYGTFAWVTCPLVLHRLRRWGVSWILPILENFGDEQDKLGIRTCEDSVLTIGDRTVLGDQDFHTSRTLPAAFGEALTRWVFPDDPWWATALQRRLAVVSDDVFKRLVRSNTDVRAHIRIDAESGTVAGGALWYQESLPAETLLVGVVDVVTNHKRKPEDGWDLLNHLSQSTLQIGGKHSTGHGTCKFRIVENLP